MITLYRSALIGYFVTVIHDGKEVSETERQFLLNWKLARRRQRKLLAAAAVSQKKNGIPSARDILQPPPPPTMPPMPTRKPVK